MSLAQLVEDRIPLAQIWNQDLLNSALPPRQIQALRRRITLQGLYQEGLLTRQTDLDLFRLAADNGLGDLIEDYVQIFVREVFGSETGQNSLDYARSIQAEGIYLRIIRDAYGNLLDAIVFLLNHPGQNMMASNSIFAWCRDQSKFRLLYQDDTKVVVKRYLSLDAMIVGLLGLNDGDYSIFGSRLETLSSIEAEIRPYLETIHDLDPSNIEDIWTKIQDRPMRLQEPINLTIAALRQNTLLIRMDRYLHVIQHDDTWNPHDCFTEIDARLVLGTFNFPSNLNLVVVSSILESQDETE